MASTNTLSPVEARGGGSAATPPPRRRAGLDAASGSAIGILVRIAVLAVVLAIGIWAAFILIDQKYWTGLIVDVIAVAVLFFVYLTPRRIPAKYLVVGTLLMIAFQVVPVILTVTTAFTNFGDGHRGSKADAISTIESSSVVPSTHYTLSVATASGGDVVFLLVDDNKKPFLGTASGLTPLNASDVTVGLTGRIIKASGYSVLTLGGETRYSSQIAALTVPSADGNIKAQGLSAAYAGSPGKKYDSGCDCITDSTAGNKVYKADNSTGLFKGDDGTPLAQGWKVGVGFKNFANVLTNSVIRASFLKIVVWNFAFAILVVAITFFLGLGMAMVMNSERLKGKKFYRSLLILPYAMPTFAMLLVWREMFNTDFGLINRLLHIHIDWFGTTWGARAAVLLAQLWVGYPYMFLVCTGALQSIPADLVEAASVDGARPMKAFRTITFPLLLVATGPLLIGSFAFNFNNFGAIFLTTGGGPFPADNPTAGSTDLLISYTYRLAFGTGGAQYGFAAAISIFIFIIVAAVSYVGFRRTRVLEEIN